MGILAWFILLVISATLATGVQYLFFRDNRKDTDYDWVYIAGGALIGGFTGHLWYPGLSPVVDGLKLLPAIGGAVFLGIVLELIYRLFIRSRLVH
jgi:cytochrome c biogenesis protein CcdA